MAKEAQIIVDFFGYFEKPYLYHIKTALATFWATFGEKFGYLLLQHLVTLCETHRCADTS